MTTIKISTELDSFYFEDVWKSSDFRNIEKEQYQILILFFWESEIEERSNAVYSDSSPSMANEFQSGRISGFGQPSPNTSDLTKVYDIKMTADRRCAR